MGNVIVLIGPTASGKTSLSIDLAKRINGEIISADSMQVYKYMDIGTAKPDKAEMDGIKHYLIDEIKPSVEFSVAKYKTLALKYIDAILEKGKVPIVVGGTGLYINSLIYNINFSETISDWRLREKLKKEAEEKGNQYIYNKLKSIDPEAAQRIHKNDVKRTIRALEVYHHTKKTISHHRDVSLNDPPKHSFFIVGLRMDRSILYERINERVDEMIEKGLVEEVRSLLRMGYNKKNIAMQGLGYKEIMYYLKGLLTYEESINLLKRDTRRYAKRQMTWFKRIENVHWVDVDKPGYRKQLLEKLNIFIASSGIIL